MVLVAVLVMGINTGRRAQRFDGDELIGAYLGWRPGAKCLITRLFEPMDMTWPRKRRGGGRPSRCGHVTKENQGMGIVRSVATVVSVTTDAVARDLACP